MDMPQPTQIRAVEDDVCEDEAKPKLMNFLIVDMEATQSAEAIQAIKAQNATMAETMLRERIANGKLNNAVLFAPVCEMKAHRQVIVERA